ncbi:MAG: hypothetical protein IT371_02540 [Deltaproteobacteria bacterium]|nr:hypothetical protein [Deltaproteobacteria bacterium]
MDYGKVVVVTSNRSVRRHVTRALVSTGCEVFHCPTSRSDIARELNAERQMYIVDAEGDEDEIRWLLEALYRDHRDAIALLLSHDMENHFILDLVTEQSLNNLVARHGGLSASHDLIDEHELIITTHKLFRRDIFGIEKYLPTWGVKVHERRIAGSDDKAAALADLEGFLNQIDCYGAIVPPISLVADELLMNAIFSAPRDGNGKPKYSEVDRRDRMVLDPLEAVDFRYACDGRYVALSVSDPFGSLDRDIIIRYLRRAFVGAQAEVEQKKAGAGLGLYMVFNSITQLTFNIQAGVRTEVIALFYVRSGARAFRASGRSLNIFLLR